VETKLFVGMPSIDLFISKQSQAGWQVKFHLLGFVEVRAYKNLILPRCFSWSANLYIIL